MAPGSSGELASAVRDELADLVDPASSPGATVSDFGGVVEATPAAVLRASDPDDVRRAFAAARRQGLQVVPRGTAHSCGGQSVAGNALLLENHLEGAVEWTSDDEVEVATGLSWGAVERALNERGRAVAVLPSILDISVAGTLAVGGYGTNSPSRGPQIDHVRGLELISPDGSTRWCAPGENEEIFRRTLAGAGQLGFISRIRLGVVEHLPDVELSGYRFDSLNEMARSLQWMDDPSVELPPYLRAFSYKPERPGIALYGALRRAGQEGPADDDPIAVVRRALGEPATQMQTADVRTMEHEFDGNWVRRYPDHRRLWIDYGFTYDAFVEYCAEVERMARGGEFAKGIRAVYVSVAPSPPHGPDYFPFDIRPADPGRTFTCGLYCMVPRDDAETLRRVRTALAECMRLMTELGGRPYVYGFNQMGPMDWRRAFGDGAVDELLGLKAELDPDRTIPLPWDRIGPLEGEAAAAEWPPRFRGAPAPGPSADA